MLGKIGFKKVITFLIYMICSLSLWPILLFAPMLTIAWGSAILGWAWDYTAKLIGY
jgi:hypothetical protein